MKRGYTILLRAAVLAVGLAMLAGCAFGLPWFIRGALRITPDAPFWVWAMAACLYASALPFGLALYQTLTLLHYIDCKNAFSALSVRALRAIKRCAVAISILFAACLPVLYRIADADDAPGLLLIGLVLTGVPIVIGTFAAVLEGLLREAVSMQSENALTI